jgi:non-ribosomal peptide synthetase component F
LILSGEMKKQEDYWFKQLQGAIPAKDISTDFSRPQVRSFEGNSVKFELDQKNTRELLFLAKKENITLFMVFLAVTNILFYKLDSIEDITVGTVVAGRRHPDLGNIIGAFVNTLVLRNSLEPNQTFRQFLKKVKKQTLDAFDNQDYRFEALVGKILVHRDPSRNPIFDVLFSFTTQGQGPDTTGNNQESNQSNTPDIRVEPFASHTDNKEVKFDLSLAGVNVGEQCHFLFSYSTKIFKQETIQRYTQYFKEIVAAVAADTNIPLKQIKLSTDLGLVVSNVYDKHSEFQF